MYRAGKHLERVFGKSERRGSGVFGEISQRTADIDSSEQLRTLSAALELIDSKIISGPLEELMPRTCFVLNPPNMGQSLFQPMQPEIDDLLFIA